MKKLNFVIFIISFSFVNFSFSQVTEENASQTVLSWTMGTRIIKKKIIDEVEMYTLFFKDEQYKEITVYETKQFGSYSEFQSLVNTMDSIFTNIEITGSDPRIFNINNFGTVYYGKLTGLPTIKFYVGTGYCNLYKRDIKKMKSLFE